MVIPQLCSPCREILRRNVKGDINLDRISDIFQSVCRQTAHHSGTTTTLWKQHNALCPRFFVQILGNLVAVKLKRNIEVVYPFSDAGSHEGLCCVLAWPCIIQENGDTVQRRVDHC